MDMLAGLSGEYILRIPPGFCASDGSIESSAVSNPAIAAHARGLRCILALPDTIRGRRIPLFDGTFWQIPQPNPAISGPVLSGSRSTYRRVVVYQKIVRVG